MSCSRRNPNTVLMSGPLCSQNCSCWQLTNPTNLKQNFLLILRLSLQFSSVTNFLPFYLLVASSKDQLVKPLVRIALDPGSWHHFKRLKYSQDFSLSSFLTLRLPSTLLLQQDDFRTWLLQPPLFRGSPWLGINSGEPVTCGRAPPAQKSP